MNPHPSSGFRRATPELGPEELEVAAWLEDGGEALDVDVMMNLGLGLWDCCCLKWYFNLEVQ